MGKVLDITLQDYNDIMADGDHESSHSAPQERWSVGGKEYYTIPMWIEDKTNHKLQEVWIWLPDSGSGGAHLDVPGGHRPPIDDNQYDPNDFLMLEVRDPDTGNVTATLNGMSTDKDEFMENLSEDKPSDQRYAYWVSLLDGDITINASKFDDKLEVGAGGTGIVNGAKGDDVLRVWHDKTIVFNGGKGVDTISFNANMGLTPAAPTGAVVNLTTGTGTNPFGGMLTLSGVENAAGVSDQANTLTGDGKANQLISGFAADTIRGEGGDDTITISTVFDSTPRAMSVDGGAGNDTLIAPLSYTDFVGSGFDIRYVNTLDLLNPAANTGTFRGGTFTGIETFRATGDTYTMFDFRGSDAGETAIGLGGADHLQGRGGNDTLRGAFGTDTIDGGDGRDVADYSDNLFAKVVAKINGASTTITVGGVQQDVLISIEGAKGGAANDKLTGDGGANELDGSLGKDTLSGKGGKDHFAFSTDLGGSNVDTIKDFKHGKDKLDLDDTIFAALGPKVSSGEFLKVSSGHAAKQKDDHLIYNKTDGTLWYDDDGSGRHAALKFAVLTSSPDNLSASDFHIV
jgi:Ca2+-binding RTX toxin-like protein